MITPSTTAPFCGTTDWITVLVDKQDVYGVDFLWTFPTGWIQRDGGNGNYVTVEPDGIHDGNITCQMRVYGDEFCEGNEIEDYYGPVKSKPMVLSTPKISIVEPSLPPVLLTYNNVTPISFTASSFSSSGHTYHWSLPCGWTGPGGETGIYVSTTATVLITPSGFSGPGEKVKVRALLNCAGTQTYSNYTDWSLAWGSGHAPSITGASTVCTTNSTFTLSEIANGSTVSWFKSSNLTYVIGQGATNYVVKATSSSTSGSGWVEAIISGAGCSLTLPRVEFWVGKPSNILNPEDLSGPSCMLLGTFDDFLGTPWPVTVPGADSYEPSIIFGGSYHGITFYSEINRVRVQVTVASNASMGLYTMQVAPKNICGYGSAAYATFQTTNRLYNCDTGGGVLFSVSPNPTGNELEVKYTDKETGIILSYDEFDEPVEYVVTDLNANIVFSKTSKKTRHTLNLSSIKEDGIYILSAYYGENLGAEQVRIVIER